MADLEGFDAFEHVIDNIPNTHIAKSNIHGNGLFADHTIRKGDILGVLDGQVMDWDAYDRLVAHIGDERDKQCLFLEWNCLSPATLLVRPFRTKYSFINHSRTPNCELKNNPLRVIASIDIEANEELTLDYRCEPLRDEYLQGHGKTYL